MATDLFEQLSFFHQHKIVHGDIKPDNILVTTDMDI